MYLQPCGRQLSGDEAGVGARVHEHDAITGINRAEEATL
jgi:hypothetical protein